MNTKLSNGTSSLLVAANKLSEQKKWAEAAAIYRELIQKKHPLSSFIAQNLDYALSNMKKGNTQKYISKEPSCSLAELFVKIGVEHMYVINVASQKWRNIRFFREMNIQKLQVERINAVDTSSQIVSDYYTLLKNKNQEKNDPFIKFIPLKNLKSYQKIATMASCSYVLTQKSIFEDATRHNYKRIIIFDDDVFFRKDALSLLTHAYTTLPKDFKILQLGTSEYSCRESELFLNHKLTDDLYHPIPCHTCGSFATIYDISIYQDIIDTINIGVSPYDNAILGYMYFKYPKKCFALNQSICIPDVESSESSIRTGHFRIQKEHSLKMNWDSSRFEEFNRKYTINIVASDFYTIKKIQFLHKHDNINYRLFYNSADGLRPVISGHIFQPRDSEAIPFNANKMTTIIKNSLPSAGYTLFLPISIEINDSIILNTISDIIQKENQAHCTYGQHGGITYYKNTSQCIDTSMHSIIIPSYRGAHCAFPAVKSALLQRGVNFEVIVVNDNPGFINFKAELLSLCEKFFGEAWSNNLSKKLIIINHSINRGASAARNTGFLHSSGNFISFLDDDDYYEPNRIQEVTPQLKALTLHEGAIYCGYRGAWNGHEDLSRFKNGNLLDLILTLDYASHYMNTNTVTFKRDAFEYINGYNESYTRHQDVELLTRFFEHFQIQSVQLFLVRNRPQDVENTFTATIKKLCILKQTYLYDMRKIIRTKSQEQIDKILTAHTQDIAKRSKNIDSNLIYNFLESIITLN